MQNLIFLQKKVDMNINTNKIITSIFFYIYLILSLLMMSCDNAQVKNDVINKKERKLYDDLKVEYADVKLYYFYPDTLFYKYFDDAIEEEVKCRIYDKTSTAFTLSFAKKDNVTEITIASMNKIIYKYYDGVEGVFNYRNYDFYFEGVIDARLVSFTDSIVNRRYLEYNYRPEIERSGWYYDMDFSKKELLLTSRYICYKNDSNNH